MPRTTAVFTGVFAVALAVGLAQERPRNSGLDLAGFDRTVRPQDDLYRFVNGSWLKRTPIPAERVTYGLFVELADRAEADVRTIAEEMVAKRERVPPCETLTRGRPGCPIASIT